jgi:adenylate kinase
MTAYKPPYYITLGIHVIVKTPDGDLVGVPLVVEEVGEAGIAALIEKMVSSLVVTGMTVPTQEEYDDFAREMAAQEQARRLAIAMHERSKHNAIDPERLFQILEAHIGRPGGDA